MMDLQQHDLDGLLGPLVDEFGVISIQKKQTIIRQISTQIDRITTERIRMSLIETAEQMKELSENCNSLKDLVTDKCEKIESGLSANRLGIQEDIQKVDSILFDYKKEINKEIEKLKLVIAENRDKVFGNITSISSSVEGSAKLLAGMMNVVNRFNESVVLFKEAMGVSQKVLSSPSTKEKSKEVVSKSETPLEKEESKEIVSKSIQRRKKAQRGEDISLEEPGDLDSNIKKGFEEKSFKDLISDAKKLEIDIKPRMKKHEIIDKLMEHTTTVPTGDET